VSVTDSIRFELHGRRCTRTLSTLFAAGAQTAASLAGGCAKTAAGTRGEHHPFHRVGVYLLLNHSQTLVKDLWALRLQRLQGRISHDSDTETEAHSSQVFSSQSESEGESTSRGSGKRSQQKPRDGTPNLMDTLSLCYIGILLLRIPVTAADIHTWIKEGQMLYYQSGREVPLGMRERLPPQYQHLLEPQDLVQPLSVHEKVLDMLTSLTNDFGMAIPSINIPLVLFRWTKGLVLPLQTFAGTQRLVSLLDLDVRFDVSKKSSRSLVRYPEVLLMACLVVATKLLFPMDTRRFKINAETDLSALPLDWVAWAKYHETRTSDQTEKRKLSFADAFSASETHCLKMVDEELDAYLDWCEDNVASKEMREHGRAGRDVVFRRAIFDMFPLQPRTDQTAEDVLASAGIDREVVQPPLALPPRPTADTVRRQVPSIGNFYRRFRHVGELDDRSKMLFQKAASLACVSLEGMVDAVFLVERKLQKVEEGLRKECDRGQ
jgi:RNA polymerase I-specific transcription initiation factor RRN7